MHYRFKNFEFDSISLVLTQNSEPVPIRHNEAKVLQLLLEQADKVLSKDDILTLVWQGKVVSDQAVFQNISHLRSIFGGDAIKTFSKRGYQWQLPFEVICEEPDVAQGKIESTKPTSFNNQSSNKNGQNTLVAFAAIVVLAIIFLISNNQSSVEKPSIAVAYIPFEDSSSSSSAVTVLVDDEYFDFTALEQITTSKYNTGAELEYSRIAQNHPLVLTGYLREHNNAFYLDFSLKGLHSEWSGQISEPSKKALVQHLLQHLRQSFIYELVNEQQSPETKQAKLSIAHQQMPDDLIVLGQLVKSYIRLSEYDKAMPLADKLINKAVEQRNIQQEGNALLLQSTILTRKELYDLSAHKLRSALVKFEQVNDLKRQADAWVSQSWLNYQDRDYPAVKESLLKSAKLAVAANDIERELHALTYLSVQAHKNRQYEDKYYYLTQAENKMREYELPIYRFAKIPFHHAIYTDNPLGKEPHLKQVLEYTKLTPNHWVARSSRQQLMEHYIAHDRIEDAQELVSNLNSDNADNVFLKTLLAQAKNEQEVFVTNAQLAFELAQLAGDRDLSLDVALLLCSSPDTQVNFDFYSQYINEHATAGWRRTNKSKLTAINL